MKMQLKKMHLDDLFNLYPDRTCLLFVVIEVELDGVDDVILLQERES